VSCVSHVGFVAAIELKHISQRFHSFYINFFKFANKLERGLEIGLESQHFLVGVKLELGEFRGKLHVLECLFVGHVVSDGGRVEFFERNHLSHAQVVTFVDPFLFGLEVEVLLGCGLILDETGVVESSKGTHWCKGELLASESVRDHLAAFKE